MVVTSGFYFLFLFIYLFIYLFFNSNAHFWLSVCLKSIGFVQKKKKKKIEKES